MGSLKARPDVLNLIADQKEWVRAWLMRGLGDLKYPESEQVLIKGLQDDNDWVKVWAAISLQKLRLRGGEDILRTLASNSTNSYVRIAAIAALGQCGSLNSLPVVRKLAQERDVDISAESRLAVDSIIKGRQNSLEIFQIVKRSEKSDYPRNIILLQGIIRRLKDRIEDNISARKTALSNTDRSRSKAIEEQRKLWEMRLGNLESLETSVESIFRTDTIRS